MTRLVTEPLKKLNEANTAKIFNLINISAQQVNGYMRNMAAIRDFLSGDHWKDLKKSQKEKMKIVVNLAHSHVRSLLPTLFFKNPTVDAMPTSPMHAGKESTWNALLNNTLEKVGFDAETKKAVFDAVVYPEGWLKCLVNKPRTEEVSRGPGRPPKVTGGNTEDNKAGPTLWLTKGTPVAVRVSPLQMIVDYNSPDRDLENARFVAVKYRKTLAELKAHPIYGKNIEPGWTLNTSSSLSTGNLVGRNAQTNLGVDDTQVVSADVDEFVNIYEVWIYQLIDSDMSNQLKLYKQMCVLMEGYDKPIRDLESWEDILGEGYDEYPFERLVLNPIPDSLPISELGVWRGIQHAINWLISRITALVETEKSIIQIDYSKVQSPEKLRQQLKSADPVIVAEITADGAITAIQPTASGRDNYTLLNLYQSYAQQVAGLGQNRRGGSGIRTATEASLVEQGVQIKTDEKVEAVRSFLTRVIYKFAKMIRPLVKNDTGISWIFRLTGDVGNVKWIDFTAEDIDWLPEIIVRVDSFRKMDNQAEMQKVASILNIGLQMFQIYGPSVRVDKLFVELMQKAGMWNANTIIGDQDAQSMLQMAELSALIGNLPQAAPVTEEQNHPVHMKMMDEFKQTQMGQQLLGQLPGFQDLFMQHYQMHQQALEEQQVKAQRIQLQTQNPFATVEATGNPATDANMATQPDRMAMQ